MIDLAKLEPVLGGYQTYFPKHWPHVEDFKWEAAQHFHDHWNIDAADFGEMFKEATAKVFSLLDTGYAYPRAMILNFAAADCEATRAMFRSLFDESTELSQRIIAFQAATEEIRTKYNDGSWNNHYQNTSAISVYLWLRYPDQYYIYRYSVARDISDALNFDAPPKRDGSVESLLNSYRLYDELRVALSQNAAITQMIRSAIEAAPAGKYWPDTHWNIAAIDLGFYLSRFYLAEQKTSQIQAGWFPAESEYDPGITTAQWSALLQDTSVFTSEALRVMKCMLDYGGQATCKQLAIKYGETSNFYISNSYHLAQRVAEKTGCRCMPRDSENMRWWPILCTARALFAAGSGRGLFAAGGSGGLLGIQLFLPVRVQSCRVAGGAVQQHRAILDVQNGHAVHVQCAGIHAVQGHLLCRGRRLEGIKFRLLHGHIPHAVGGVKAKNKCSIVAGSRTVIGRTGNSDRLSQRLRRCLRIGYRLAGTAVHRRKGRRAAQQAQAQGQCRCKNPELFFHRTHPPLFAGHPAILRFDRTSCFSVQQFPECVVFRHIPTHSGSKISSHHILYHFMFIYEP